MFGEAAQNLINQKNQHRSMEARNMKMADKQLIDMDNARAQQIADQQQAIRDQQRRIMRDENLQLMN